MDHRDKRSVAAVDTDGTREYLPRSRQRAETGQTGYSAQQTGHVGISPEKATSVSGIPLFPIGSPIPIATGSLSPRQNRARKQGWLSPDLALSGEWPRSPRHYGAAGADDTTHRNCGSGSATPEMEPDVVENQLREREEFPYG